VLPRHGGPITGASTRRYAACTHVRAGSLERFSLGSSLTARPPGGALPGWPFLETQRNGVLCDTLYTTAISQGVSRNRFGAVAGLFI
jgi:hypothetical protein